MEDNAMRKRKLDYAENVLFYGIHFLLFALYGIAVLFVLFVAI
jgi:hypothetical protein